MVVRAVMCVGVTPKEENYGSFVTGSHPVFLDQGY